MHYQWPGNVRELEQCIRRLIVARKYTPPTTSQTNLNKEITAQDLLINYSKSLYDKYESYAKVSQILQLDRRTVKKYITDTPSED